jgi:hypothetical protein
MSDSMAVEFWRERIGYYSRKHHQHGRFSPIWRAKLDRAWLRLREQQRMDAQDDN